MGQGLSQTRVPGVKGGEGRGTEAVGKLGMNKMLGKGAPGVAFSASIDAASHELLPERRCGGVNTGRLHQARVPHIDSHCFLLFVVAGRAPSLRLT